MNHKVDLQKPYAPYFLVYIKVHNLKNGDSYKLMAYKDWIMEKHDAFAEKYGLDRSKPYNYKQMEQFIKFINEGWEPERKGILDLMDESQIIDLRKLRKED